MTTTIVSREAIEQKARIAARTYNNVNDACPYPFAEPAGQLFKAEFIRARAVIEGSDYSNTTVGPAAAVGAEQAAP